METVTTLAGIAALKAQQMTVAIMNLRMQQQRNLLATLLCSQGVPMLCAGDEFWPHAVRQQQCLLPGQ